MYSLQKCCVLTCINNAKFRVEGTSFHRIPKDETNRRIWLKALNQPNLKVDNNTCVCSSHFKEEHLVRSQRKTRLLSAAVPLLNIGFSSDSDDSFDYLPPAELSNNLSDDEHITETTDCQPAEIVVKSKDDADIPETNTCQPNESFLEFNDHDYVSRTNISQPAETDTALDHPSPTEQSPESSDIEFVESNPTYKPVEIFVQSENASINRLHRETIKLKKKLVEKNKIIKKLQQQVRRSRTRLVKLEARVKELLIAGRYGS